MTSRIRRPTLARILAGRSTCVITAAAAAGLALAGSAAAGSYPSLVAAGWYGAAVMLALHALCGCWAGNCDDCGG